jgi:acyl-CoA reductase-like NAD-dependent aldehyde dehydrogenase
MSECLKVGTIWINTHTAISNMAPFGGYKDSGLGCELKAWGLRAVLWVVVHLLCCNFDEKKICFLM